MEHLPSNLLHSRVIGTRGYTERVSRTFGEEGQSPWRGIHHNGSVRAAKRTRRNTVKKIGFLTLLMTATLLFTLAFPAAAAGPKAPAAPAAPAAALAAPAVPVATPDRHPHIDEALEAMRNAKHQLETAEHDFDGHRRKSIEHLDAAIHEAEICMSMR